MSQWKLVEAEPESPVARESQQTDFAQQQQGEGSGRGNRENNGGRGRGGRGRGGRGRGYTGPYRSKTDRSYFAYLAVQQIDLIFNPDSLCIDTFIRAYMDEEGYVPIMLVTQYQNVAALQCSYYDIFNKLKECVGKTKNIELDAVNECVRLREGWEKFLMPNPYGGRGLPRYRKQNANHANQHNNYYGHQEHNAVDPSAAAPTTA